MASAHQRGKIPNNFVKEMEANKVKSLTLSTKALNVIWGGSSTNQRYWKKASDGSDGLELVGVYWLEVSGRLPLSYLTEKTKYSLYFNIKLTKDASGWDNYPVFFNLRLPGQKSKQTSLRLSGLERDRWHKVPAEGLEINVLDQASTTSPMSSAITFAMYEIECEDLKKGLIIKDVVIEMAPNSR